MLTRFLNTFYKPWIAVPVSAGAGSWKNAHLQPFQINRPGHSSTARTNVPSSLARPTNISKDPATQLGWAIVEAGLIVTLFGLICEQLPPDVNESHYLTKAKHFWDPAWCPGDIFLSSSFSHWLFYVSTGWITKFVSLSAYAWIGRVFTWCLLAIGWQRLSFRLIPVRGMAVITAITFLLLNDQFQLAGEWVVGGFEAKGIAYACVIFALERMVNRRWSQVWILLGLASAMHVLVGGWATIAAFASWLHCEVRWPSAWSTFKLQLPWLLVGLLIAGIGMLPPLISDLHSTRDMIDVANRIYVDARISHHLLFGSFPALHVARFGIMVFAWAVLARFMKRWIWFKPIQIFCLASLFISFGGLILSGLEEQPGRVGDFSRGLLRFYWFRLSDFAVPTALSLSCGAIVNEWVKGNSRTARRFCGWLFILMIFAATCAQIVEKRADRRPVADQRSLPTYPGDPLRTIQTFENWRKVCVWIKNNTPTDSLFITPAEQQTFKWYAERAEVACWKDVPQDAAAMIQWYQRIQALCEPQKIYLAGLMAYDDEQLTDLATEYGADYLLLPQSQVELASIPSTMKQVYPEAKDTKSTYVVLKFER